MCRQLFLVRHGHADVFPGAPAVLEDEDDGGHFDHSADWPLSTIGIEQAQAAGRWLIAETGGVFGRYLTSSYERGRQTAGHLGLPLAAWYDEDYLRGRDRGVADERPLREREKVVRSKGHPIFGRPWYDEESIAELAPRAAERLLSTIYRDCLGMERVVVVCHREVMWCVRKRIEGWSRERLARVLSTRTEEDEIPPGAILHYSRWRPDSYWRPRPGDGLAKGALRSLAGYVTADARPAPRFSWVRLVWPWKPDGVSSEWRHFKRRKYSNDELLTLPREKFS